MNCLCGYVTGYKLSGYLDPSISINAITQKQKVVTSKVNR